MTVAQVNQLRALALALTASALRRPWVVQTSNSFRRIGTDDGDGDVLCATIQQSDGHPDLHAAPGVLAYIVAAHPSIVLELLDQRDRAWQAIDYLSRKIAGHDEVFVEAGAIRLGGVTSVEAGTLDEEVRAGLRAVLVTLTASGLVLAHAPDSESGIAGGWGSKASVLTEAEAVSALQGLAKTGHLCTCGHPRSDHHFWDVEGSLVCTVDGLVGLMGSNGCTCNSFTPRQIGEDSQLRAALAAMTAARDEACRWIADRSSEDSILVTRLRAVGTVTS